MTRSGGGHYEGTQKILEDSAYVGQSFESSVLPLHLSVDPETQLDTTRLHALHAIQKKAARMAVRSVTSLAKTGEVDHLGCGLDLIPVFTMTQSVLPAGAGHFSIEHAHTRIGYYSVLAALGYLTEAQIVEYFRLSVDMPSHVSWVPGGTRLDGGRPDMVIPEAVDYARGLKARSAETAWYICHTGDACWVSDQVLKESSKESFHGAPITFVMHRNGIHLSGSTVGIMDKDPRPIIESLGIEILEIKSLLDVQELFAAYQEGRKLAAEGKANLIYPSGYHSSQAEKISIESFGDHYGIADEAKKFSEKSGVAFDTEIWVPGSLMSYRDVIPMLNYVFLVNTLPVGEGRQKGNVKGRSLDEALQNPMLIDTEEEIAAIERLENENPILVIS